MGKGILGRRLGESELSKGRCPANESERREEGMKGRDGSLFRMEHHQGTVSQDPAKRS